jgi:hypothetical protein
VYVRACAAQQPSQRPVASVMNKLHARSLVLKHYALGPGGASALATVLAINRSWTSLNLADSALGEAGGEAIARALVESQAIQELDVSNCGIGGRGVGALSTTLHDDGAPRLHTLRLRGNRLGDDAIAQLARALVFASHALVNLDVSDNKLGPAGARSLALTIQQGLVIRLDAAWNGLGSDGGLELLAGMRAAVEPDCLTHLGLAWNGLGERGGIAMGEALVACPALVSLELAHNCLEEAAAHAIAHGLTQSKAIERLDLSHNPLGRGGLEVLMRALEANSSLSDLNLSSVESNLADGGSGGAERLRPFDRRDPAGTYRLDLSAPWERWIATQLREIVLSEPGVSIKWATLDESGAHDGAEVAVSISRRAARKRRVEISSEEWAVPSRGVLELELETKEPRPTSIVHYALDLSKPRDRDVARQLWLRALAEPGENWLNETLNGHAFALNESGSVWELPEHGLLELDYATFQLRYEERYELDLSLAADRSVLIKLLERAVAEDSENCVRETMDGVPINLPESAAALKQWSMPERGRLVLDFVCAQPQHVSTRHFSLDLSIREDWLLAERLRQWALCEPGENW